MSYAGGMLSVADNLSSDTVNILSVKRADFNYDPLPTIFLYPIHLFFYITVTFFYAFSRYWNNFFYTFKIMKKEQQG